MIAEHFSIGETCVSNILRNVKTLQKDYEFFEANYKNLDTENTT